MTVSDHSSKKVKQKTNPSVRHSNLFSYSKGDNTKMPFPPHWIIRRLVRENIQVLVKAI